MNIYKETIEKQREFFKSETTRDLRFRANALDRLENCIEENTDLLMEALKKDLGKSETESYMTEIGICFSEISYMKDNLKRLSHTKKVKTPRAYIANTSRYVREPLGNVLIIVPWNYPVHLALVPLAGAIAAGNTVLIKVSSQVPETVKALQKTINETFDEEYIHVADSTPGEDTGLLDERFDKIFFTGSPATGRIVMEKAAKYLTPVTLELGGKSPCIVTSDVNLDKAAKRICFGKFTNAGQTCVAPDYLLVHRDIKDKLIESLKKNIIEFYGIAAEDSSDYGRIVNKTQYDRLMSMLEGHDIVYGGYGNPEERFIAPTIVDCHEDEDLQTPLMTEEIFGPILPVVSYTNINHAIQFINSRPKPLALYIFTREKILSDMVIDGTSSGGVCINDTLIHMTSGYLPFGGVGESGMGQYHGEASFDNFSHKKSIMAASRSIDTKVYPPYSISLDRLKNLMKFL